MSFSSQFHMPGAYYFDAAPATTREPAAPSPALSAGIFRPPISPSASSSVLNLAKSTGSLISDASAAPATNQKRKRARDDATREGTPLAEWTSMNADGAYEYIETPPADRGGPRQARYTLAGQIETPSAPVGNPLEANLEDSVYSDVDYRRALGSKRTRDETESPSTNRMPSGAAAASSSAATPSDGWSVFSTIGGVVGKVWEFCRGGAFRGFYAGGGRGYELGAGGGPPEPARSGSGVDGGKVWCNEHDVPTLRDDEALPLSAVTTPLPGRYPEPMPSDYDDERRSTPRPAAKRRQVSGVGDELRRNWVLVDPDQEAARRRRRAPGAPSHAGSEGSSQHQQPQRRRPAPDRRISVPVSRLGGTPNLPRRPSSRISHAGSPSLTAREPASFAPPRSPVSASRPTFSPSSRLPVAASRGGPNPFARAASPRPASRHGSAAAASSPAGKALSSSSAPPPAGGHRRNASNASAASTSRRRTGLDADDIEASPRLDAEAKHLASRKLAADRDTDARIESFNARLREMIRQGKEALGTTVEVDLQREADGEMWMDDE